MANSQKIRVMVFGTFDGLHKGHSNFFRQARKLSRNPFLIVSIARDINVKKIKGKKSRSKERQRLLAVKNSGLVDKVILGGIKNHIPHIFKEKPDIIALGYDQQAYVKNLGPQLAKKGLKVKIIRLKSFYPKIYKSSKFAQN